MSSAIASRSASYMAPTTFGRWRQTLGAAFNAPYGSSSSWSRMKNVAAWSGFFFFQAAIFNPTSQLKTPPSRAASSFRTTEPARQ